MEIVWSIILKAGGIREGINMIKEGEDNLGETDGTSCESSLKNWNKRVPSIRKIGNAEPGNKRKGQRTKKYEVYQREKRGIKKRKRKEEMKRAQ